jgi:hypothetical protein
MIGKRRRAFRRLAFLSEFLSRHTTAQAERCLCFLFRSTYERMKNVWNNYEKKRLLSAYS